jgi:hypothetical protein
MLSTLLLTVSILSWYLPPVALSRLDLAASNPFAALGPAFSANSSALPRACCASSLALSSKPMFFVPPVARAPGCAPPSADLTSDINCSGGHRSSRCATAGDHSTERSRSVRVRDDGVVTDHDRATERAERERRRRLAEVFGDVLPDNTADDRPEPALGSAPASDSEGWYRENRPPHHEER